MSKRQTQAVDVCWNTITGKVVLTLGFCRVALSAKQAERIAEHLMAGADALDEDANIDTDLDQHLRDQLNSEVSAAMDAAGKPAQIREVTPADLEAGLAHIAASTPAYNLRPTVSSLQPEVGQGPAAPPSSSVSLGGTARLAEELGSARETLAEILEGSHHAPRDERDARPTQIKQAFEGPVTGFTSPPRPHYETLMLGLAEHPTDAGKILINGKPLSLGHARNYGIALHRIIEAQQAKAFGRDLQATVSTAEPPAEIPTLRAD